jgi:hypothetical protein
MKAPANMMRFLGTVQRHQDQHDKGQVGEGLHQVLNAFSVGQKNTKDADVYMIRKS